MLKISGKGCTRLSVSQSTIAENRTHSEQRIDERECRFLSVTVSVVVGEWQEGEDQLFSFETPKWADFQGVGKKETYACIKLSLTLKVARWKGAFDPDTSLKVSRQFQYKTVEMHE